MFLVCLPAETLSQRTDRPSIRLLHVDLAVSAAPFDRIDVQVWNVHVPASFLSRRPGPHGTRGLLLLDQHVEDGCLHPLIQVSESV